DGVGSDTDAVKRMLDWVAGIDKGLVEPLGYGIGDIFYYQTGNEAKDILRGGGFRTYIARRKRAEFFDRAKQWSPIAISGLALIVSILAWLVPRGSNGVDEVRKRVDGVSERLDNAFAQISPLVASEEQLRAKVENMQSKLQESATMRTSGGRMRR